MLFRSGGSVWLDADLTVHYYPRSRPGALVRQYYMYGRGRAQTLLKHRLMPRLRQLAPVLLVVGELGLAALAPLAPELLAVLPLYLACLIAVAGYGAWRTRNACVLLSPIAFAIMHHAWGIGFLSRLLGARPTLPRPATEPASLTSRSAHS